MKKILFVTATSVFLAGCAQKSTDITASYVSPVTYQSYSCNQLSQEAQRVSQRVQTSVAAQDKKAGNDTAMTAVSLVLFWPAAFMIKGDGDNSSELARLKGEMDAIEQANIQKRCGLTLGA